MPVIPSAQLGYCSYVVPDLDAAVAIFTDYLGFEVVSTYGPVQAPADDYDYLTRTYAVPERSVGRGALLRSGNGDLEFAEWKVYDHGLNPLRESSFPGCHIALRVPDLEETLAVFRTIHRMLILDVSGDGFVYCITPFGFQIKLIRAEQVFS